MSEYEFRLCTYADKEDIVAFMDDNWGSAHPLVHNNQFFTHYYDSAADTYGDNSNRPLQFALALENGVIVALAGYIYTSRKKPVDIWVSIWCALKGKNGVGLELMANLPKLVGARVMACNNIRPKTMPFYTFLGYIAQGLPHYYRLANKNTYSVAKVFNKKILPLSGDSGLKLELVKTFKQLQSNFTPDETLRPNKDMWYIERRYFNYPYKTYEIYGVANNSATCGNINNICTGNDNGSNSISSASTNTSKANKQPSGSLNNKYKALLVCYTVNVSGTNVLRIVDFIGEHTIFGNLAHCINSLMQSKNAEYADCYCYGISEQTFNNAGFILRTSEDTNIIPNYLNPPLYENTDYYFFTSDSNNFTMFKADGDQDRPNI